MYLYFGRTVEVNNTDAEGRLVLGDGVAFAKKDLQVRLEANLTLDEIWPVVIPHI